MALVPLCESLRWLQEVGRQVRRQDAALPGQEVELAGPVLFRGGIQGRGTIGHNAETLELLTERDCALLSYALTCAAPVSDTFNSRLPA